MTEQYYLFNVKMTCSGCSGAVTRVLNKQKADGAVDNFTVSLETQEVKVWGKISFGEAEEVIRKTGKEIRSSEIVEPKEEPTEEVEPVASEETIVEKLPEVPPV